MPAETGGHKVKTYVQMPFKFDIDLGALAAPLPWGTARPREGRP